jgi:TetR/AcrR family fatty acid metabolism transcriptional regulator
LAPTEKDKQERILGTAVKLFGRQGYYGTRMSQIAQTAKVSPKTLYKYYASKKQLFMATREASMEKLLAAVVEQIPEQPPSHDSLMIIKNVLHFYSDFISKNRGMARILAEAVAMVDEEIKENERDSFLTAVTAFALMMEDDVRDGRLVLVTDPEKTAVLFLSLAALLAYAVLLDLDKKSVGDFDPASALDLFFDVMHK